MSSIMRLLASFVALMMAMGMADSPSPRNCRT